MPRAALDAIAPFFIVTSLPASVAFYRDKLAFDVTHQSPDGDPFFAIVQRRPGHASAQGRSTLRQHPTPHATPSPAGTPLSIPRIRQASPPSSPLATSPSPLRCKTPPTASAASSSTTMTDTSSSSAALAKNNPGSASLSASKHFMRTCWLVLLFSLALFVPPAHAYSRSSPTSSLSTLPGTAPIVPLLKSRYPHPHPCPDRACSRLRLRRLRYPGRRLLPPRRPVLFRPHPLRPLRRLRRQSLPQRRQTPTSSPSPSVPSRTTSATPSATPKLPTSPSPFNFPTLQARYGSNSQLCRRRTPSTSRPSSPSTSTRSSITASLRSITSAPSALKFPPASSRSPSTRPTACAKDFTQTRHQRLNIGGYRWAVHRMIPRIAYALTILHRKHEPRRPHRLRRPGLRRNPAAHRAGYRRRQGQQLGRLPQARRHRHLLHRRASSASFPRSVRSSSSPSRDPPKRPNPNTSTPCSSPPNPSTTPLRRFTPPPATKATAAEAASSDTHSDPSPSNPLPAKPWRLPGHPPRLHRPRPSPHQPRPRHRQPRQALRLPPHRRHLRRPAPPPHPHPHQQNPSRHQRRNPRLLRRSLPSLRHQERSRRLESGPD